MDLTLRHKSSDQFGIFGILEDEGGHAIAVTLEHAYASATGFNGKIPPGRYKCVRGPHRLHSMTSDFETFEVTGVVGHDNILFHWGNYNKDSDGCILLGDRKADVGGSEMITNSKVTFAKFMELQKGLSSFELRVI